MPIRRLILLRHAKSAWDHPELEDHDRPLNERGVRSAKAIGGWLMAQDYLPDQVLCSTAVRTRQTWDLLGPELAQPSAPISYRKTLYHAPPEAMRAELDEASGNTVLMIGHNPGIAAFAAELAEAAPAHPKFTTYPTAATLVLEFDVEHWAEIHARQGRVLDFIVPRELTD